MSLWPEWGIRVAQDTNRWVSKQTFIELWEAYQKALTEIQQLNNMLQVADKANGWLSSEVARVGDLARAHSDRGDKLQAENKTLSDQLQCQAQTIQAYQYESQALRDLLAKGQGGQL